MKRFERILNNRFMVYFDSHRKIFSLKSPKTGRVEYKTNYLEMRDCTLRVSQKGRERVIKTGRKNVHAYVDGEVVDFGDESNPNRFKIEEFPIVFGYSPHGMTSFEGYTELGAGFFKVYQMDKVLMWVNSEKKPRCRGNDGLIGIRT